MPRLKTDLYHTAISNPSSFEFRKSKAVKTIYKNWLLPSTHCAYWNIMIKVPEAVSLVCPLYNSLLISEELLRQRFLPWPHLISTSNGIKFNHQQLQNSKFYIAFYSPSFVNILKQSFTVWAFIGHKLLSLHKCVHLKIYDKVWTLIFYMLLFYDVESVQNTKEDLGSSQQPQE